MCVYVLLLLSLSKVSARLSQAAQLNAQCSARYAATQIQIQIHLQLRVLGAAVDLFYSWFKVFLFYESLYEIIRVTYSLALKASGG